MPGENWHNHKSVKHITPILHRRDAKFINHGWARINTDNNFAGWRSATHAHRSNRRQLTDTDYPAYQSAAGNRFRALPGFSFLYQAQDSLM
jgi:hypothetical protein